MSAASAITRTAADPTAWRHLVAHDPAERSFALVHRDEEVELYVVGWMAGHDTGFHDHDDSAAAILVVEGEVVEERLGLGGVHGARYRAGDLVEIPAAAIHRVRHTGVAPAVTLHAYSPPLRRVGQYEVEGGVLLRHARPAETPLAA